MRQANLSTLAYEQLLQSIVSFKLVPGTTLQERTLAEQLEMSRTPVREALLRLTQEGWVQNSRKRNVMEVKPLAREDVEELFEMRQMFEMRGLEIIFADKLHGVMGRTLQVLVDRMRAHSGDGTPDDEMEYMSADITFHTELMSFKKNSRLSRFWNRINLEFLRLGIMALKSRNGGRATVADEHEDIIRSIAEKKKKNAREAVRHHNEQTKLHIFRSLDDIL